MFEPVRGGTRGGQAEFKWSDVSADKDREHYLGHSINAPTGRWQKNKDVHWYNRDLKQGETEKQAELRRIKEAEAEAMAQALGFAPAKKTLDASTSGNVTANSPPTGNMSPPDDEISKEKLERRMRKLEKRAKKTEKKARKEAKQLGRRKDEDEDDRDDRYKDRRRSRSPRRRDSRERSIAHRRRSTSPFHARRHSASPPPRGEDKEYDFLEQERERERDRRRWDANITRDLPRYHRSR